MSNDRKANSRGKWLAIVLVALGVIAALAEWKFRVFDTTPAVTPAAQR